MSLARRWLSNSAANVVGGLSFAVFNLAIPGVVSRHLPAEQFAAWSLALQVVAYVNLLGLGLQTATARAIAHAHEARDDGRLARIVRASASIARWSTVAGLLAVVLLCIGYPAVFPSIPADLLPAFRLSMLLIGASTALQLLALVPMGVLQGLHQNVQFVAIQVLLRALTVAMVWLGTQRALTLVGLATIVGACTVLLLPLVKLRLNCLQPALRSATAADLDRPLRRELLDYCATLSVWSVSTLLVNCVGIVMVGRVAFTKSGPYSIAMAAATVLAGLLAAVFSPLITAAAALHADPKGSQRLPGLLMKATWACAFFLHVLFACTLLLGHQVMLLWVGPVYADSATPLMLILVGSHALRNLATPYASMLLATGLQRRALVSGAAEGLMNLFATVVLGLLYGVTGVALGTLVAALFGLVFSLSVNPRNTPEITPSTARFVLKGFVLPTLLAAPIHGLIYAFAHV